MADINDSKAPTGLVLLTGATGYVGGLLLKQLETQRIQVRCFARSPHKIGAIAATTEIAQGDVLDPKSLAEAMRGVEVAYYLVHSMGSTPDFEEADRNAARLFGSAAKQAGVQRIIYLGGLGDESDPKLSPHLRSRHEVGRVLRESGVETIELRASAVLGAGSLSFEMIRSLTNRLPIMICPRWLATPTQPIAASDLIQYLLESRIMPPGDSRVFEIGGSDVVTYGELIREYAKQSGLRRWLISVPVLTPYLSGLWLGLVTPATAEVGRHLIEGLRNPTIVNDSSALQAFSVEPMDTTAAIRQALDGEDKS
jgi:uncharacterized protein YbjT (DUF2867 family)